MVLMSTRNPYEFDNRVASNWETQMVEDIWSSVDEHALFHQDLRQFVSGMTEFNFSTLKQTIDEEISRSAYVPNNLRFQDRNGVIENSKNLYESARMSRIGSRRNL